MKVCSAFALKEHNTLCEGRLPTVTLSCKAFKERGPELKSFQRKNQIQIFSKKFLVAI